MQARVIGLGTRHGRRGTASYRVQFDYQVGPNPYQGTARIDKNEFQALKENDRIPVTYMPDDPSISTFNPSAQIKTARLEQILALIGLLALMVWSAFVIRNGIVNGWTTGDA